MAAARQSPDGIASIDRLLEQLDVLDRAGHDDMDALAQDVAAIAGGDRQSVTLLHRHDGEADRRMALRGRTYALAPFLEHDRFR